MSSAERLTGARGAAGLGALRRTFLRFWNSSLCSARRTSAFFHSLMPSAALGGYMTLGLGSSSRIRELVQPRCFSAE